MALLVHCDNMKNNLKPFSWALLGLVVSLQWEIWEMPFISVLFGLPQKPNPCLNFLSTMTRSKEKNKTHLRIFMFYLISSYCIEF